jgi:hypothetical protein
MVNAIGTISTLVATALAFATGMLLWYSVPGLMASPDISDSERGFLTDKLSLVPRLMAVSSNNVHGSSSTWREDKGGSVTMAGGGYQTHSCLSAKA